MCNFAAAPFIISYHFCIMKTKLRILFEDNHLIAVNKASGDISQADATNDRTIGDELKAYIKEKYQKPGAVFLGVIHRLDRPVSGVNVFARTSKALERMNKLLHDRQVEKVYWAVTNQRPAELEGTLVHYLRKDTAKNFVHAHNKPTPQTKEAILDYKLICTIGSQHLLEVRPRTGRQHQIRVQLAKMGCVIKGDKKYGQTDFNEDGSIHLHCRHMIFAHPVTQQTTTLTAAIPHDPIWDLFRHLQQKNALNDD